VVEPSFYQPDRFSRTISANKRRVFSQGGR
jgi:hypothetical protein